MQDWPVVALSFPDMGRCVPALLTDSMSPASRVWFLDPARRMQHVWIAPSNARFPHPVLGQRVRLETCAPVDPFRTTQRYNLLLHRLIARRLRRDGSLLGKARVLLRHAPMTSLSSHVGEDEWSDLLSRPVPHIRHSIVRRTRAMAWMRLDSPLLKALPHGSEEFRLRVWLRACLTLPDGARDPEGWYLDVPASLPGEGGEAVHAAVEHAVLP